MLQKSAGFAAIALAAAVLVVPDATFARGGGIGGFHAGGLRAPFFSPRAVIHRAPFTARTGPAALGHNARGIGTAPRRAMSTLPPPTVKPLPVHTHVGKPFAHLVQRHHGHHHRYLSADVYPFTTWDDGSYIGVPYDPGAAIPVYGPAPAMDPAADSPAPQPVPRLSSAREENQDACRSERVTVPAGEGEREITVVRC
jgi:hypothetical protein